jgi:hypothetical protein
MDKPKTFFFTKEELEILAPQQAVLNNLAIMSNGVSLNLQSFIASVVLKRLAIDPLKENVNFNIANGTLTVTPKIIAPQPILKK